MTAEDFLCDFCGRDWTHAAPFVEGHHGACICGECLRA
ncbi:MAG: ClpX C4-type zinc finger, partial [Planctomycetota bacterium]